MHVLYGYGYDLRPTLNSPIVAERMKSVLPVITSASQDLVKGMKSSICGSISLRCPVHPQLHLVIQRTHACVGFISSSCDIELFKLRVSCQDPAPTMNLCKQLVSLRDP